MPHNKFYEVDKSELIIHNPEINEWQLSKQVRKQCCKIFVKNKLFFFFSEIHIDRKPYQF